ncbi:hypothetical protein HA402_013594 [Bradysia odoriphaga]|nr:hypothetical protein HA402_013594 [Bradysia odoriphaga]
MDLDTGSWFASIHSLSAPIGAFVSGPVMDRYGRRPALMAVSPTMILGWILIGLASSHPVLLAGRFVAGVAVGMLTGPAQIIIAECAEPRLRGFFISVPFVSYAAGILFTYSLGTFLNWRTVAWCCNVLPILSFVALYLVPESPVWLVKKKMYGEAEAALTWFRCNPVVVRTEMSELVKRCEDQNTITGGNESIFKTCSRPSVLKPLVLINIFHLMMILSGTYLIIFYASKIISDFGTEVNTSTAAVYTAIARLFFTISASFLMYHLKRRTLSIVSGVGSCLSTIILAVFTYSRMGEQKSSVDTIVPAICILCYLAANTNFMVLPGVMVGELLPAHVRGRIAGYIFVLYNIMIFLATKLFPYVSIRLKSQGVFMMFGLASFGAALVNYLILPETKGKTLGEIEDYFQGKNWFWFARKDQKNDQGKVVTNERYNETKA